MLNGTMFFGGGDTVAELRRSGPKICTFISENELRQCLVDRNICKIVVKGLNGAEMVLLFTCELSVLQQYTPSKSVVLEENKDGIIINPFLQSSNEFGPGHYTLLDQHNKYGQSSAAMPDMSSLRRGLYTPGRLYPRRIVYTSVDRVTGLRMQELIDAGRVYYLVAPVLVSGCMSDFTPVHYQRAISAFTPFADGAVIVFDYTDGEERVVGGFANSIFQLHWLTDVLSVQDYWAVEGATRIRTRFDKRVKKGALTYSGHSLFFSTRFGKKLVATRIDQQGLSENDKIVIANQMLRVEKAGFYAKHPTASGYQGLPSFKRAFNDQRWGLGTIRFILESDPKVVEVFLVTEDGEAANYNQSTIVGYYVQLTHLAFSAELLPGELYTGEFRFLSSTEQRKAIYIANLVFSPEARGIASETYLDLLGFALAESNITDGDILGADTARTLGNTRLLELLRVPRMLGGMGLTRRYHLPHTYAAVLVE